MENVPLYSRLHQFVSRCALYVITTFVHWVRLIISLPSRSTFDLQQGGSQRLAHCSMSGGKHKSNMMHNLIPPYSRYCDWSNLMPSHHDGISAVQNRTSNSARPLYQASGRFGIQFIYLVLFNASFSYSFF